MSSVIRFALRVFALFLLTALPWIAAVAVMYFAAPKFGLPTFSAQNLKIDIVVGLGISLVFAVGETLAREYRRNKIGVRGLDRPRLTDFSPD